MADGFTPVGPVLAAGMIRDVPPARVAARELTTQAARSSAARS